MRNDRAALYAAILANPADDAPRLIFADYLDENGEPERAEFIRAQVELARLDESAATNEALGRRCWQLEERFAAKQQWAPRLPKTITARSYSRGFIDTIRCRVRTFLRHAAAIDAAIPLTHLNIGETTRCRCSAHSGSRKPVSRVRDLKH